MDKNRFWKTTSALFVLGIFYVGHGLHSESPIRWSSIMNTAEGSVGVADENSETLFTASADGRRIFMWQYFSSKPPKFLGESEAIASE